MLCEFLGKIFATDITCLGKYAKRGTAAQLLTVMGRNVLHDGKERKSSVLFVRHSCGRMDGDAACKDGTVCYADPTRLVLYCLTTA